MMHNPPCMLAIARSMRYCMFTLGLEVYLYLGSRVSVSAYSFLFIADSRTSKTNNKRRRSGRDTEPPKVPESRHAHKTQPAARPQNRQNTNTKHRPFRFSFSSQRRSKDHPRDQDQPSQWPVAVASGPACTMRRPPNGHHDCHYGRLLAGVDLAGGFKSWASAHAACCMLQSPKPQASSLPYSLHLGSSFSASF